MGNKHILTKKWCVCLLATICCLLWGSAFPSIKIGYQLFAIGSGDTMAQILFAGLRFTLAGVLTILFGSLLQRKVLYPKKSSFTAIGKLAMIQTVIQYLLFYIGLAHTTGVKGSVIETANIFLAILLSSLVFHQEKLNAKKILGCVLGFAGVILINLDGSGLFGSITLLGEGFVFLSAFSYALSSVLVKSYSKDENPVVLSGYQFVLGGLIMTLIGRIGGGTIRAVSPMAYVLLIYMGLLSAVAYSVWSILLKYNDVSSVTIFGFTNPIFGFFLSCILLNEAASVSMTQSLLALLLVCVGIYIVNRKSTKW